MTQDTSRPAVILVEGEVLVRFELAAALEGAGMRVIPLVNGDEALQVLPSVPDLRAVVIDVELPSADMSGLELARTIRDEHHVGVVICSGQAVPELDELPSGMYVLTKPVHHATLVQLVRCLVRKSRKPSSPPMPRHSPAELAEAVPDPAMDQRLTRRQHEILDLLMQGKSNPEIAQALGLSPNTVKVHLVLTFRKLGVSSRTEAVIAGLKRRQPS